MAGATAGISFEEMMGTAPPKTPANGSVSLPSSAVSFEDMVGGAAKPTAEAPSFLDNLGAGAKKYWTDYVKLSNEYASAVKGDVKADPKGLADQVVHTGKTLLDLMGAAFSPVESIARTGVIEPVQAAVNRMSELARQHLASPDIYNAQERRERFMAGEPVKQQYPGGVDWHIHQTDVARTAEDLNKFIEIGALTGVGFLGVPPTAEAAVAGEAGSARLPLRQMTRMEASSAANALKGLTEISTEALDKFPNLKDSVERLTSGIKQLAIQDPEAAQALADHVGGADAAIGQKIKDLAAEATSMNAKAQEALGTQMAKPRLRQVGITAEGKPILRIVPPNQGIADSVKEGYEALQATAESTAPRDWNVVDEPIRSDQVEYFKDWQDLHEQMKYRYEGAFRDQRPVGAHVLLDTMAAKAAGEFQREFIAKLRQNIDDVPVKFVNELHDIQGRPKPFTLGQYKPLQHEVEIRFNINDRNSTRTTLHELAHAATVRWIRYNESHPLMRELNQLHSTAKEKLGGEHYGLKNTEEFIAEAFTNVMFQDALSKIRTGQSNLFSKLASIVRRIFGMKPGEESLLERVMRVGEDIMQEQKAAGIKKGSGQAVAMEKPRVRLVSRTAEGKPIYESTGKEVAFHDNGVPVTREALTRAFTFAGEALEKIPGMPVVMGKLKEYYTQAIQTVNPEAFGPEAKAAAAVLAKRIAIQMQRDSFFTHQARIRRAFWERRQGQLMDFIKKFEKGEKFSDPELEHAALLYRVWNERILNQDLRNGLEYEPVDNYLYHVFKDSEGVAAFLTQRFGPKWNNPKFIKERGFETYAAAVEAGFKPLFTNPEDIMLARQHASDVAQMRIDVLKDLERFGLARSVEGPKPEGFMSTEWRAPNGERYWVHQNASRVMQNAFNTKSLWTLPGLGGDLFRGAMWLKNTIVPVKLALSLFHPLHVATIDNVNGIKRAAKELLSGTIGPVEWFARTVKSGLYGDFFSNPKMGNRILRAYQGKLETLTEADDQALRLMAEGGFVPEMSSQYRTQAMEKFTSAVRRRSLAAAWHLPFAAIDLMQKPLFQVWIPSLKIASYLKDVQTAFRTDPMLMMDPLRRQVAMRKIAKSVDNQYGEMAYNTLFWNRWVKDLAVANTLSLGWQMGLIREYGGGTIDLAQMLTKQGTFGQKVKTGMLDRPLFVTFYTTQALAYGGLMTWAFTGKTPQDLLDYIYPKNGEENSDGSPQRVTTMFYPREFAAIYKHMENEGVVAGLSHLVESKASGVIGMTHEWATGVNSFGQEIRDPNASRFKQVEQTLAHTLTELEPISVSAIKKQATESPVKTTLMNIAGFSPAPKYVTEARTEGEIKRLYQKYYAPRQTPFEKAQFSSDFRDLRRYWENGDQEKFGDLLDKMQEKYELTGKELRMLEHRLQGGDDSLLGMFSRLSWQQQKRLLDKMTEDERAIYLPRANRQHLRYSYEPPSEK